VAPPASNATQTAPSTSSVPVVPIAVGVAVGGVVLVGIIILVVYLVVSASSKKKQLAQGPPQQQQQQQQQPWQLQQPGVVSTQGIQIQFVNPQYPPQRY
jgi:predicted metalloprotease